MCTFPGTAKCFCKLEVKWKAMVAFCGVKIAWNTLIVSFFSVSSLLSRSGINLVIESVLNQGESMICDGHSSLFSLVDLVLQ